MSTRWELLLELEGRKITHPQAGVSVCPVARQVWTGAAGPQSRAPRAWWSRDVSPLSLPYPSNKPNPNQISVNNVKAGVVNGAGAPGQSPGAGRACESCYSKCPARHPGAPSPQPWAPLHCPGAQPGGGGHALPGKPSRGAPGARAHRVAGGRGRATAV